jgi:hypothetical protein
LNVRLGKSLSHHCGNRLDGGHAVPAQAVRLSLRRRTGQHAVRDLQGHGTPTAQGDHKPRYDRDMVAWHLACLEWRVVSRRVVGLLVRWVRDFSQDRNQHTQRFYRIINEVPTLLLIAIVILAVVKPF